jgi:hypothetical protein
VSNRKNARLVSVYTAAATLANLVFTNFARRKRPKNRKIPIRKSLKVKKRKFQVYATVLLNISASML